MTPCECGVLRSVCALSVLGAPPTLTELAAHYDQGANVVPVSFIEIQNAADSLAQTDVLAVVRGRYVPSHLKSAMELFLTGEEWMPRKLRKAKRIARWLACIGGIRGVFLCNRTAFGLPRDEGDLDFFIIVRHGSIWQTRGLAGLPFVLLRDRPAPSAAKRDAVCLSFFLSDQALDLSTCALPKDDVYLRHWFLGLLPLIDDGVSQELWDANGVLRARHPFAEHWLISPDLEVKQTPLRIPVTQTLERAARSLQWKYFPRTLREKANQDTRVMISDERLKFHADDDGREVMQAEYVRLCTSYGIAP